MLSPGEKETLKLFLNQMDIIRKVRLFKRRQNAISISIKILPGRGLTSKIKNFKMDEFRSALVSLRQFYAPREKINLYRVCNILERAGIDKKLLPWIRAARQNWTNTLKSCPSHYFVGNKPLLVADAINLFFNGVVFHSDPDKAREWLNLAADEKNFHIYSIYAAWPQLLVSLSEYRYNN